MNTISGIQQKYNLPSYNDRRAGKLGKSKARSVLDAVSEMMLS